MRINRRTFIHGTAIGLGSIPILSRVIPTTGPIEINLFFTTQKKQLLQTLGWSIEEFTEKYQQYFSSITQDAFNISVNVTGYDESIELLQNQTDFYGPLSRMTRSKKLLEWQQFHRENNLPIAPHSNILIGTSLGSLQGVGVTSITPSCCFVGDSFGVVWSHLLEYASEETDLFELFRMISHEVGHNIGLVHGYGYNEEDGHRSIMLSNAYASQFTNNFFGESVYTTKKEGHSFNPKISMNHLTL